MVGAVERWPGWQLLGCCCYCCWYLASEKAGWIGPVLCEMEQWQGQGEMVVVLGVKSACERGGVGEADSSSSRRETKMGDGNSWCRPVAATVGTEQQRGWDGFGQCREEGGKGKGWWY